MKIDTMTNIKTYIFIEDIKRYKVKPRFKKYRKNFYFGKNPNFQAKNYNYAEYHQNNK
jgi:hypothetical protein